MNDTKDRITPVAFAPADAVMNLPLARPWRRALAMLCDLAIIALLTQLPDAGLGIFLLVIWLVHKIKVIDYLSLLGRYRTWVVRLSSLLVVVLTLWMMYPDSDSNSRHENLAQTDESQEVALADVIEAGSLLYQISHCDNVSCIESFLAKAIDLGHRNGTVISVKDIDDMIDDLVEDKGFSVEEIAGLKQQARAELARLPALAPPSLETDLVVDEIQQGAEKIQAAETEITAESQQESLYSPLKWLIGFAEDLGLGFGFAAIYFSCFTAWFNGQTFGKMLLNTKVIQLNNSEITLWESFGRYGGYGAGLATGLLGFFQVYWDPNRQAIQDKISATVVIDLGQKAREQKVIKSEKAQQAADVDTQLSE